MLHLKEFVERTFNTSDFLIIREFGMLHTGWAMDNEIKLIKVYGKHYVIGTNHGSPVILSKEILLEKASEYTDLLTETISASRLVD